MWVLSRYCNGPGSPMPPGATLRLTNWASNDAAALMDSSATFWPMPCWRPTLKTEFYDRRRWHTKAEARIAVGAWLEDRYNRRRRHSSIRMLTPVRFEESLTQTAQAA